MVFSKDSNSTSQQFCYFQFCLPQRFNCKWMPEHFMTVLTKNTIANSHGVLQNSFIRVYTLKNISQEPTSLIGHVLIVWVFPLFPALLLFSYKGLPPLLKYVYLFLNYIPSNFILICLQCTRRMPKLLLIYKTNSFENVWLNSQLSY